MSTSVDRSPHPEVLAECEKQFRSAFDRAAIGMAIIDAQGAFVYTNPALSRLTGYAAHELCGLRFTETLHPEDRASRLDIFQQLLDGCLGLSTSAGC